MDFLNYIVSLGASVMIPIVITIFGVILGLKVGKSLRGGLMVGVGFIGLNLVIGLLGNNLGPAAQMMVKNFGLSLTTIDVGWPAAAAIAFASQIGALIIPLCIGVNVLMLVTKTTQTLDVDIWNFWHFAFTGSLVAILTDSLGWGLFAAAINFAIVLVLADYTAPNVEKYLGLPGVSLPHGFTVAFVPFAIIINKALDYIPGINKIHLDAEVIQEKLGVLGEPILLGTVIGMVIGVVAGYDVKGILTLGISMGAVLVLIPRMAALLMEGLMPVSEQAQKFLSQHFSNTGKLYIGLDSAVGIGSPTTLSVALILVPLTLFIAVVLPGNTVLPFADLATFPFMLVLITPVTKGDVFRTFVIGVICVGFGLLIATNLADIHTIAAANANFAIPEGAVRISSICDGANPLSWVLTRLVGDLKYVGAGAVTLVTLVLAMMNRRRITKENA